MPDRPQDRPGRVPPQAFFGVSAVFHYLGPSLAVLLFARLDVLGVAWLRVASAAAVFALWRRPWRSLRPLARGMLAGNRNRRGERRTTRAGDDPLSDERYSTDADFDAVDRLAQVAAERGAPPAQVALAWLLSRPGVTAPIIGATRLGHISDALAAGQLTLTAEEIARLEEPYVPHPVLARR